MEKIIIKQEDFNGMNSEEITSKLQEFFNEAEKHSHEVNLNGMTYYDGIKFLVINHTKNSGIDIVICPMEENTGLAQMFWEDFRYAIDTGKSTGAYM